MTKILARYSRAAGKRIAQILGIWQRNNGLEATGRVKNRLTTAQLPALEIRYDYFVLFHKHQFYYSFIIFLIFKLQLTYNTVNTI